MDGSIRLLRRWVRSVSTTPVGLLAAAAHRQGMNGRIQSSARTI
jgi:hypothetical protein